MFVIVVVDVAVNVENTENVDSRRKMCAAVKDHLLTSHCLVNDAVTDMIS